MNFLQSALNGQNSNYVKNSDLFLTSARKNLITMRQKRKRTYSAMINLS